MRRLGLIALLLITNAALADGKAFTLTAPTETADQQAVLHWADGRQTLLVQTGFETRDPDAPAAEWAWVLPVPGEPTVEALGPIDAAVFEQLAIQTPTRVMHARSTAGLQLICLAFAVAIWVAGRPLLGALLFALLVVFFFLSVSLGGGLAQGTASAQGTTQTIGGYDTAIVQGDTGDAIHDWLADAGFTVAPDARATMDAYARDGWWFVVAQPTLDRAAATITPGPLRVACAADAPVYPMRLTGAGATQPLALTLYVLGPGRAEPSTDALQLKVCRPLEPAPATDYVSRPHAPHALHPALAGLATPGTTLTRLTGTLPVDAMQRDVALTFGPAEPFVHTQHSRRSARHAAVDAGAIVIALALPIVAFVGRNRLRAALLIGAAAFALAFAVGGLRYRSLDVYPGEIDLRAMVDAWQAPARAAFWGDTLRDQGIDTVADARAALDAALTLGPNDTIPPPPERAIAGGCTLATNDAGQVIYTWYDDVGQPHHVPLNANDTPE